MPKRPNAHTSAGAVDASKRARASMEAAIRISDVRIQDFRVLRDVWIPLAGMTLVVGPNNSGKTAFIDALAVALGERQPDVEDLFVDARGQRATRSVVDLRLVPSSGDEFDADARNAFGEAVQVPIGEGTEFVVLRTEIDLDKLDGAPVSRRRFVRGWAPSRADADTLPVLEAVRAQHLNMVLFHQLDARRDLVADMRNRRSFWGRLTRNVEIDVETARKLRRALEALGARIKKESAVLGRAQEEIRQSARALGAASVRIEPLPADLDDLTRSMDVLFEAPRSAPLSIGRQGMGTRSVAALQIFRTFVALRLARGEGPTPLALTAFEEPEAHIHPQAHRAVLDLIQTVPRQKIVSTHSPFVATSSEMFDIRMFRRDGAEARCHWLKRTPDGTDRTPILDADALEKLRRLAFERHAEVLFARLAILFEGDTEAAALPVFASRRWRPSGPDAVGISFVNCSGAGGLKHPLALLEQLRVPWVALVDGDKGGRDGIKAAEKALGRKLDPGNPASPLVVLPQGRDFERYVAADHPDIVEAAVTAEFGADALAQFRKKRQGEKRPGGGVYDYGDEDGAASQLLGDFLAANKVRGGRAFAERAVALGVTPTAIDKLFNLADRLLAGARP